VRAGEEAEAAVVDIKCFDAELAPIYEMAEALLPGIDSGKCALPAWLFWCYIIPDRAAKPIRLPRASPVTTGRGPRRFR
jgi:hypothetical protein